MNRRQFLAGAGVLAAGALVPGMQAEAKMMNFLGRHRSSGGACNKAAGGIGGTWGTVHANITLSGGNLIATNTGGNANVCGRSSVGKSTGKWYWETLIGAGNSTDGFQAGVFISTINAATSIFPGYETDSMGYGSTVSGQKYKDGSGTAFGDNPVVGDVIGIALDMGTPAIWFSRNGVWQDVSAQTDPDNGLNPAYTGFTAGTYYPAFHLYYSGSSCTLNISGPYTYCVPTGFN